MCTGPLSSTYSTSSLFLVIFARRCVPQPFSSSLMLRDVTNAEDSRCFQPSKNCRNVKWMSRKKVAGGCSSKQEAGSKTRDFRYNCENFTIIAKISQS